MIELTDTLARIIRSTGHLLVTGGPGSGKTTVAILKAAQVVSQLRPGQRVLLLSFARASVSRVIEAIDESGHVTFDTKRRLMVDTYHAFFWRFLRSHSYLLGLPRHPKVLATPGEAVALANIRRVHTGSTRNEHERAEKLRLATAEGLVCFDLFADLAGRLLIASRKLRLLVANAYPTIILDEFQDTTDDQWAVIQALGHHCELIAHADPEQRIYGFAGAHPRRIQHFSDAFRPTEYELGTDNHRSTGTDIVRFANDVVTGRFSKMTYTDVTIQRFPPNRNQAFTRLYFATLNAIRRLRRRGSTSWSLAILVPTKKMTRMVSDSFRKPTGGRNPITHTVVIDMEAAILAAEVVAYTLQQHQNQSSGASQFIELVSSYYRGKGGDSPAQSHLEEAARIERAYNTALARRQVGKQPAKNSLFVPMERAWQSRPTQLTGNPAHDWVATRKHLAHCGCKRLKQIAEDVRDIRLLRRGTQLRQRLSQAWRENGHYGNVLDILRYSLVRQHFATSRTPDSGVVVMNMHKAKGKQFDEIILFEGWPLKRGKYVANQNRIVRDNLRANVSTGTRYNLRVSVSRAKKRATILTPASDPCVILPPPPR